MEQDKAKKFFWVILDVLLGGLFLVMVFFGVPATMRFMNSLAPTRTMTVSASGKATVTPDLAQGDFSVVTRGKNPQDLADENNQKMTAVIEFLKTQGLADKDIQTTAYNLQPDYQYDTVRQRNYIVGYVLTQTVSVKMRDFSKIADIIGGLTPLGVNQIGSVNFTIEDDEKYLALARADAFGKLQAKAVEMAAESGVTLGQVVNVAEYQPGPIPYYSSKAVYGLGGGAAPAVATPTIAPGSEELTDQVTVTYEIR